MKEMGNLDWIEGYKAGYWGWEFDESRKDNDDYTDGYGRGYETAEVQSANQEYWENQKCH